MFCLFALLMFVLSACNPAPVQTAEPIAPTNTPAQLAPTATPAPTISPTLAPTPTPFYISSKVVKTIKQGESANIVLAGWLAATPELVQQYMDNVEVVLKIDDVVVTDDFSKYWEPIVEYQSEELNGYLGQLTYPISENPALKTTGIHNISISWTLTASLTDGFPGENGEAAAMLPVGFNSIKTGDIEVLP